MFLRGCEAAGLANTELFVTKDLYDANDIPLVGALDLVECWQVLCGCLALCAAIGSRHT
jgi:hypothetical protein